MQGQGQLSESPSQLTSWPGEGTAVNATLRDPPPTPQERPFLCGPPPLVFSVSHTAVRAFSNFKSDVLPPTWNRAMVSDPSSKVPPWGRAF